MILAIEHLADFAWLKTSYQLVSATNQLFELDENVPVPDSHILMQWLSKMSKI